MQDGFIKVAAGTPEIRVADCAYNAKQCIALMKQAQEQGVKVLALPELCLTGAACGDLFFHDTLLQGAEDALAKVLEESKTMDMLIAVGLPVRCKWDQKLYNCGAVLHKGELLALVPKTCLPGGGPVDGGRWFSSGHQVEYNIDLSGQNVTMEPKQIVQTQAIPNLVIGVEVGEDLMAPCPPSVEQALSGVTLMLHLCASPELVGQADYQRRQVMAQSARLMCGYVCANAGEGESTTDLVFAGHRLIVENGTVLAEGRFDTGLTISEVDVDKLTFARRRTHSFRKTGQEVGRYTIDMERAETALTRPISKNPFVPADPAQLNERCEEMLTLAAMGLKKRLAHTGAKTAVVGLSGGLDSTLALLITAKAMDLLGRSRREITAITMPCFGTTSRTKSNAQILAERMGTTFQTIDIGEAVKVHFKDIGQSMEDLSVTFENGQARERTQVLMDVANRSGGMVIGTGDLSELALGWATYNGDHMSMYSVNGSIPKTLVRHLVAYYANQVEGTDGELAAVLRDILDTPVSPELLPPKEGEIAQKTEDLVGPYELHDFFLYYILRWGFPPRKVFRLAQAALGDIHSRETILKWLKNFYRRFFAQQFKRSCLPDGPKVGTVGISPRGDWHMPSDAMSTLWMEDLEIL